MTLLNPFLDIRVIPSYGEFRARIIWKMMQGFETGLFVISKSPDGVNGWETIGAIENNNFFDDIELITGGKFRETYYQVRLHQKEKTYESSITSTFGQLTREEFGVTRYIMELEYKDLKRRTSIRLFKLRVTGEMCSKCTDETGQSIGLALCETCFGTGFEGGYWRPPLATFMRVMSVSPIVQNDSQEGVGAEDPMYFKARMMAFPSLITEDLIVDPMTDRRWLVEQNNVFFLNGKAPTVTEVSLVLLRRTDVRYKLPLT